MSVRYDGPIVRLGYTVEWEMVQGGDRYHLLVNRVRLGTLRVTFNQTDGRKEATYSGTELAPGQAWEFFRMAVLDRDVGAASAIAIAFGREALP
jgi:hypothetical protein